MEWRVLLAHGHAELPQHLQQHRIGLELKKVLSELDRGMAVSQMVGGSHQGIRRLGGDEKDVLPGCFDFDQGAVFSFQKIAVAQHRAAWQEKGRFSTVGQARSQTAPLPEIERQHQFWEITQLVFGNFAIGVSFDPEHGLHLSKEISWNSEQEITLSHRQDLGRLAGQEFTIGNDLVGFRVDSDLRLIIVTDHIFFPKIADTMD